MMLRYSDLKMEKAKMIEIQEAAKLAAIDAIKLQIEKGAPKSGMPKARHIAILAYTIHEILGAYGSENADENKAAIRAALSGDLTNASQFRQNLEKAKILEKEEGFSEADINNI